MKKKTVKITTIIPEEVYEKIREMACWEKMQIKDIVTESLQHYIKEKYAKLKLYPWQEEIVRNLLLSNKLTVSDIAKATNIPEHLVQQVKDKLTVTA